MKNFLRCGLIVITAVLMLAGVSNADEGGTFEPEEPAVEGAPTEEPESAPMDVEGVDLEPTIDGEPEGAPEPPESDELNEDSEPADDTTEGDETC